MDIEYVKKIQKWVEYDNILTKHKTEMKDVVEKKKELEENILKYVEDNKYDKLTINISDGNIKFSKRNVTQPLSMKTLKIILDKYNSEHQSLDVPEILKYIDDSLEVKKKILMSREISS
jgi:hypothetical protein